MMTPILTLSLALLAAAPCPAQEPRMSDAIIPAAETPSIGEATMEPDGTIILRLRAVAPNAIGEAQKRYPPNDPSYKAMRDHLPDLKPGMSVPVPPFD